MRNTKLGRKYKEAVVDYFELLSRRFSTGTHENYERTRKKVRSGRGSNQAPPEYKSVTSPLEPNCRICYIRSTADV